MKFTKYWKKKLRSQFCQNYFGPFFGAKIQKQCRKIPLEFHCPFQLWTPISFLPNFQNRKVIKRNLLKFEWDPNWNFLKHGNSNFWNVLQIKNGWQQTCPRLRGAPMTPIFNFSHGCGHDLTAPSDNFPHLEVEVKCRDWLFQAEIALLIFILFFPLQLLVEQLDYHWFLNWCQSAPPTLTSFRFC